MTALVEGVAGAGSVAPETPVRPGRRGARGVAVRRPRGPRPVLPRADRGVGLVHRPGPRRGRRHRWSTTPAIPGADGFAEAFTRSLAIAGLTVVIALLLMVPTVVLVNLRLPRLRTTVELLTLMPLVLPPIALVVGVRSVLAWAPDYFLGTPLAEAFFALQEPSLPWILVFVYVVLALPFVYRALDAGVRGADLRTLTEAARNLGASWPRVLVSVVLPVLQDVGAQRRVPHPRPRARGVHHRRHPRASRRSRPGSCGSRAPQPQLSVAVSVLSLVITWVLLLLISALDRRRGTKETS